MTSQAHRHRTVAAPVTRVTVLEDRAQIRRAVRLTLESGRHELEVQQVTPLLVDRSLRGGVSGQATARLVDLKARRCATVAATRPWLQQQLEQQADHLRQTVQARNHELELTDAELTRLHQVRGFLLEHISQQAGRGTHQMAQWQHALEQVEQPLEQSVERRDHQQQAIEDLELRLDRLDRRILAATTPTTHYWATLHAVVEIETAGDYEVAWEYLVPCALWRPAHQAELVGQRLRWSLLGTVWQNTGEPWDDVALRLSTERPTLGAELPLLDEDLLQLRPRTEEEKRTVEVSSRDEEIESISPGVDPEARVSVVPGVDDGGEVRVFELAHSVTIPSDGRAHLVALDDFECDTTLDRVCFPELAEAVMLRSRQQNEGTRPLLAGPVRLVDNGAFVGRTQVPFVAPGERFAVGWGSRDELQVRRRTGQTSDEKTLTRRVCHSIWTRIYLSNTGPAPCQVVVTERIPVSEVEQVQVKLLPQTTPGYQQSDDGHLVWDVELPASGRQEILLTYQVDAHRKVVWRY